MDKKGHHGGWMQSAFDPSTIAPTKQECWVNLGGGDYRRK